MPANGRKAAPKKKANGYQMPPPIRQGHVITDRLFKKQWCIGPSIGTGGFGEIYSACEVSDSSKKSDYCYAIKIEPHANGPLFVEKNFYLRNAHKDTISNWMKEKKLTSLGMPTSHGSGSMEYDGATYRYLILDRYGKDIWSLYRDNNKRFPATTAFQLGIQMIDVLEYIHHQGYVHADIKAANMLLGYKKGTENQVYLVDYGLATKAYLDKEFKPNPKCAHNGTLEYTSRDAHLGVSTLRGDLEILGYNMLQWIVGELPWQKVTQPKTVQDMKEAFMKNVQSQVKNMSVAVPEQLIKYLEYVNSLKPKDVPDYEKCRQILESYLKKEGKTKNSKLDFIVKGTKAGGNKAVNGSDSDAPKAKRGRKAALKATSQDDEANDSSNVEDEEKPKKVTKRKVTKTKKTKIPAVVATDSNSDTSKETEKTVQTKKRKSTEPALLVKGKKTKLTPKPTPPAKKNHANIATQTSVERGGRHSRHVSFESPVSSNMEKSINSSGDIFDDTFEIQEKKVRPKKKLLAKEEVTVKKVVRKKTTAKTPARSWKDFPTIVNGRSPPK